MGSRLVQLKLWMFSNQNQLEVWLFLAQTSWDTPNFMLNGFEWTEKETHASSFQLKESHEQMRIVFRDVFRMCSYWRETPMPGKGQNLSRVIPQKCLTQQSTIKDES